MNNFNVIFIYFSFCAFFGWILETFYRTLIEKRFINAGFLYGPLVPIYGIAALFIYYADIYSRDFSIGIRLIIFLLIPTIIEYLVGMILERVFNIKLWDYSNLKINFNGKISLLYSLVWFILVLLSVYIIQPKFIQYTSRLSIDSINRITILLIIYLVINIVISIDLFYLLKRIVKGNLSFIIPNIFNFDKKGGNKQMITSEEFLESLDYKNDMEFNGLIEEIIGNEVYQRLKYYRHHQNDIYEHSLSVAYLSYRTGVYLNKYIKINISDLTRGALLHDFFLYDWRTQRPASGKLHAFEHPKEAYLNSEIYFSPISKIEKDIILKHMWPLNIIPPRYIETLIVVGVDKYIASLELMNGAIENRRLKRSIKKE